MRVQFIALSLLLAAETLSAQKDSTVFDDLLFTALQGKLTPVLQALDTLDDAALGRRRSTMKQVFLHRFRSEDEAYDFRTRDTTLIAIMRIYHRYWTDVLLDGDTKEHDIGLSVRVAEHLRTHVPELRDKKPKWLQKRWNELLKEHLMAHGCYSGIGRTAGIYDLLLHMEETEVRYPVTTPEDTLDVKVVFMDSVICHGWEGYATLDTYYPGGWTTNDALYCARSSYDLASENFTVSYLKHEGKHFADYKRFPKLEGADLEYRAKLVELSTADSTLYRLIDVFMRNSAYDALNPHAYANFCVVRDLSRTLFNKEREADMETWKRVEKEEVHRAAKDLLGKHTQALQAAGAKGVKALVK